MAWETVKLVGGVNTEFTPAANLAGISKAQLVRFRNGMVEKLGGWSRFHPDNIGAIPRVFHAWSDLNGVDHLGIGGHGFLGVITNGVAEVISPQFSTLDFAPNFSTTVGSPIVTIDVAGSNVGIGDTVVFNTPVSVGGVILSGAYPIEEDHGPDVFDIRAKVPTWFTSLVSESDMLATSAVANGGTVPIFAISSGSPVVTVTFPGHGFSIGNAFSLPIPVTAGGITLSGLYSVSEVLSASQFQLIADAIASSDASVAMNGGNAQIVDWIAPLLTDQISGYGIYGYGSCGYGAGCAVPVHTGSVIPAGDWTLDHWGDRLIACAENGPIFSWTPAKGVLYAQVVAGAPIANGGAFVAMPEQILIAWGSEFNGVQDQLLVRWSSVNDLSDWIAGVTDQAGSRRIPRGSSIIGGLQGPQQALLWTDLAIWSVTYIGYPFVFGFNEIAAGCGLIGKHAAVVSGSSVFWMGQKAFFALVGGAVQTLPCPVWDAVFQNLDKPNSWKIRAGANAQFNEVVWYYPSPSGSGENNSYVKLNTATGEWDYGTLARSSWLDESILGAPLGGDPSGVIYQHEISTNGDGAAITSSFETGFFTIGEGEDMMFIDLVVPDFKYEKFDGSSDAQVSITLYGREHPWEAPDADGPYLVSAETKAFEPRLRARFVAMKVESSDLSSFWRLGAIKFRVAPDGRQ